MFSATWKRAGGNAEMRDILLEKEAHDYHKDEEFWQKEIKKPRFLYMKAPESRMACMTSLAATGIWVPGPKMPFTPCP